MLVKMMLIVTTFSETKVQPNIRNNIFQVTEIIADVAVFGPLVVFAPPINAVISTTCARASYSIWKPTVRN